PYLRVLSPLLFLCATFLSLSSRPPTVLCSLFLSSSGPHRDLHSFPTRRSSDLSPSRASGPRISSLPLITVSVLPGNMPIRIKGKDRKSTRLNSSHVSISYAVFCLKKKKQKKRARSADT